MRKIKNQKHSKETLFFATSKVFERASYYGLRAIILLYMIGETLKIEDSKALIIFGWLLVSLLFSQIIGGIFGDLIIGNKKSIIIGGIIQAIGAFILCVPSINGLYIGLFLVVLGNGFFTPNFTSNFGKLYLNKTKLLDSGFTILYFAINLGSFFGVLLIGYIGNKYGYNFGFIFSGVLMLLSIIPIIFSKEKNIAKKSNNELLLSNRILNILVAFIVIGVFWQIYEISNTRVFNLQLQFSEISSLGVPEFLWQSINVIFILPISLFVIVFWSFFYKNQFFKLMLGFIFGALSLGVLFLIPDELKEQHSIVFMISLFFLTMAEIHISPTLHSVLTKYTNPKYLAILISLAFLPGRLISLIFGLFNDEFYDNPMLGVKFGIIIFTVIGLGLLGYNQLNKKTNHI